MVCLKIFCYLMTLYFFLNEKSSSIFLSIYLFFLEILIDYYTKQDYNSFPLEYCLKLLLHCFYKLY